MQKCYFELQFLKGDLFSFCQIKIVHNLISNLYLLIFSYMRYIGQIRTLLIKLSSLKCLNLSDYNSFK